MQGALVPSATALELKKIGSMLLVSGSRVVLLAVLLSCCSGAWQTALALNVSPDFVHLLDFKAQLDSQGQATLSELYGWNASTPDPCHDWLGVQCYANTSILMGLDLGWSLVGGGLSADLGSLQGLQLVRLNDCALSGPLPPQMASARNLTDLYLRENSLSGEIPGIWGGPGLANLRYLDLSRNHLSGPIPPGLEGLSNLFSLDLSRNELSGPVPPQFGTNLTYLMLGGNQLTGAVPCLEGLANNLAYLDLSGNNLSGPIAPQIVSCKESTQEPLSRKFRQGFSGPSKLDYLSKLFYLNLSSNSLSGPIPAQIASAKKLRYLCLQRNSLSGAIPSLKDLTNLEVLDLSGNNLSGRIGNQLQNLSKLKKLDLSDNRLQGPLPAGFVRSARLYLLDLSGNNFIGQIPQDLFLNGQFAGATLNLSSNSLSGTLSVAYQKNLRILDVSNNQLDSVDIQMWWPEGLQKLSLSHNRIAGNMSEPLLGLKSLSSFRELRLQGNRLTGSLDELSFGGYERWQVLDLRANDLSFNLSGSRILEALLGLRELRLGSNTLLGDIPMKVGRLPYLEVLDLSNSSLRGQLSPDAFNVDTLPSLRLLDLSNNLLNGSVPPELCQLRNLTELYLGGNDFSGQLPDCLPRILDHSRFFAPGNSRLCGGPLQPCLLLRPHHAIAIALWQLLVAAGGCILVIVATCMLLGWRWRAYSRKHQQDAELIAALQDRDSATLMPLRELRRATKGFSPACQIGVGGFGTVYLGELGDGAIVAIKRSKREGREQDKHQFLNEVKILSQVHHRNLVRLLGCCLENKVALLVFEFVPNGTLQELLRRGALAPEAPFTWTQRLKIALQTADALAYLHSSANPPIIHRDVKSANILLDDDLNAKVADFGISRLTPVGAWTHISTGIQGTVGYLDPEYFTTLRLNSKSDVYSFGVVLLELVSGRAALDLERGTDDAALVTWAVPRVKMGNVGDITDPLMSEAPSSAVEGQDLATIVGVAQLAAHCLEPKSRDRPTMRQVFMDLHALWLQLDPCNHYQLGWREGDYENSMFHHETELARIQEDSSVEGEVTSEDDVSVASY